MVILFTVYFSFMKSLFPSIEPFNHFFLKTKNHSVYVEECGNPSGVPIVFLHGGPCSGCKPDHRRFFDPLHYHIILFDQRGSGRSLPFGELEDNTLPDLMSDMETIRKQLNLENWILFGGSWGATLSLAYAQKHVDHVRAIILRGSFLARNQDMMWFSSERGVASIYPESWQALSASIPHDLRTENLLADLISVLWGKDELAIRRVAKAWQSWGGQVALGNLYQESEVHPCENTIKQVRMELHYAKNHYFLKENELLENCNKLTHLPITLIHGRADLMCPIESAWKLRQALPQAKYVVLPNAGHIAQGDEMIDALINATEEFKEF
jgi:proline iminopeptidase